MPELQKFEERPRSIPKRNSIPIHYARGTHYEVGYSVVSLYVYCYNFVIFYYENDNQQSNNVLRAHSTP